jgi:hypothetical protein
MEINTKIIDPIFERLEKYANTNIELYHLKLVDKSSEIATHVILKSMNILLILLFFIPLNLALALYLGDYFGKMHLGFLSVSVFYYFIWIVFRILRKVFRNSLNNRIITQLISSTWKK